VEDSFELGLHGIERNSNITVDGNHVRIWKETTVAYLKTPSLHSPCDNGRNTKTQAKISANSGGIRTGYVSKQVWSVELTRLVECKNIS
jgi:hypothetical protein